MAPSSKPSGARKPTRSSPLKSLATYGLLNPGVIITRSSRPSARPQQLPRLRTKSTSASNAATVSLAAPAVTSPSHRASASWSREMAAAATRRQ